MNYMNINFSQTKSENRLNKANKLLGKNVVNWIIGFVLFLHGARRKDVSELLGIPYDTFNSFIKRIWKAGIRAFKDRRVSSTPGSMSKKSVVMPGAELIGDEVIVYLPHDTSIDIRLSYANKVVLKAVLLTLMQNKILDSQNVAAILDYTKSHTLYLSRQVEAGSTEILFDRRRGQKQDYVFIPEVKAELIQQCSANAIAGKSTASEVLATDIKERCDLDLADRSIRYHIQKLGLKNIAVTLPEIIERLKKNSGK